MRLDRCGDMLTLEVENYRGPGKTFWEYRSHSGPFFRGNVRSAFLLEAAPRGDFPDLAAFERHIAGSRIADVTSDDLAREITWSCDDGVLSLRYSLVDMRVISRSRDGEPLPMPPSRAGALDGRGIQSVLAHAGVATLGQVRVVGAGPTQIIADADHGRYVAVRASGAPRPLLFETPDACVECDAFGIGRIAIGETQGAICVEAADACSPLTFTGGAGLRLLVNGSDVTAQMRDDGEGGRVFAGMDEAAR
ncbi:MAG: hypothetical protein HYX50_03425 [Chloroflexi bacterium]|nr:hypothetical protein [Chloroflexota bacterium]